MSITMSERLHGRGLGETVADTRSSGYDAAASTLTPLQRRVLRSLDETPRDSRDIAERAGLYGEYVRGSRVSLNQVTTRNVLCWLTGKQLAQLVVGERFEAFRWRRA